MAEFFECLFQGVDVIERKGERQLGELFRHSRRAWDTQRGHARTSLHQQRVGMAVIAALELHNIFSVSVSASQTDGRHGGFSARTDEAYFLDVGESRNYDFR